MISDSNKAKGIKRFSVRFFENQSIFIRIFVSLMSLLIILILVITFWVNHVSSRGQQTQIMKSSLMRMEAANRTLEQVLDDLTASMTQLLWNSDLLSYMLLPGTDDYYTISRQLTSVAKSTWAVKQVSFHSEYTGKVFQSDVSKIYDREEYPDRFLLEMDWPEDPMAVLYYTNADRRTRTYLITSGGRMFLLQNLFMGKSLGSVIYELNTAVVSGFISNTNSQPENLIYPYDQNGSPVLPGVLTYPFLSADIPDTMSGSLITVQNVEEYRVHGGEQYYMISGDRLPWTYLMRVNQEEMRISLMDTILTWLPVLGMLLLISVLITAYILHSIYRPVNRLLKLSGQHENRADADDRKEGKKRGEMRSKNEFAVLENAYSQAMDQQAQMSQLIENAVPDILDSTLIRILNGRPGYTDEKMEELLRGIGSPVPVKGRFLLCTCVYDPPEGRVITEGERDLSRESLRDVLKKYTDRDYLLHLIPINTETTCILLSFPEDTSAVAIRRDFTEIQRTLEAKSEVLPFRLWVESGHIYQHLTDSFEAYQEGLGRIRYRRNTLESSSTEATGEDGRAADEPGIPPEGTTRKIPDRFRLSDCSRKIVSLVVKGERQGAYLLTDQTIHEIEEACPDLEQLKSCYEIFLEEMTDKVAAYPLTKLEQELIEGKSVADRIWYTEDPEALQIFMLERCRQICHIIYTYNQKNRYKYVDQAKNYIGEHYKDSSLALGEVAEHIGISASYLSELWSEQSGDKFSGYLASFRVEKARQLLNSTDLAVKDVGARCGFNSVQNFNRVFKKYTGMTPGQYRSSVDSLVSIMKGERQPAGGKAEE